MPAHRQVTVAQERVLLQLMQENPDLANNRASGPAPPLVKQAVAAFWESVASQLNAMGTGATKVASKWRDYWTERKYGVRKKAAILKAHATGTGGPAKRRRLTDVELEILQLMGKGVMFGEPAVQIPFDEPSTSEAVAPPPPVASPPPSAPPSPHTTPPPSLPPLQQHLENRLTTHAPAWAIHMEQRRSEIENRQLEMQEQLALAVNRLATAAEMQTANPFTNSGHKEEAISFTEEASPSRTPTPPPTSRSLPKIQNSLYSDPMSDIMIRRVRERESATPVTGNDEISTFGTFVAAQLRKFEPRLQSKAKLEISKILFNIENEQYENSGH